MTRPRSPRLVHEQSNQLGGAGGGSECHVGAPPRLKPVLNLLVVQRFRRRSGSYSRLWSAAAEAQHYGSRRSGASGPPLVPPLVAPAAGSGAASLDTLGAQASPAYPDHPIAGALIAAASPLGPWIWLTPSFPTHVLAGVHLVPIGPEGQSALDRDPDDQQRRRFGARSYGDLSDAVVVIGKLATAGGVVVCEGLAMGWRLPAGAASPWSSRSVRRAWSSEATAFALGRFASVMLAPSGSRTGRGTAGALVRRVQAYGADKRAPHVWSANDDTVTIGALPYADPVRFKETTQSYVNTGLPRWEAARCGYVKVTASRSRSAVETGNYRL